MARIARKYIKSEDEISFYHIFSHSVWEAHKPFSNFDKEFLLRLLRHLSEIYFVDVISYAFLDNHFHLLVRVLPGKFFSEDETIIRARKLYPDLVVRGREPDYWKRKFSDISAFVKELKQRFTQWYNKQNKRRGHLWEGRFKSIRIETGKAVVAVSAYIDLNPIRAGITKRIDGYRFTSYAARKALSGGWLLPLSEVYPELELKEYGRLLEEAGKVEIEGTGKVEEEQDELVVHIIKYRAEGIIYGSLGFLKERFKFLSWNRKVKIEGEAFLLA